MGEPAEPEPHHAADAEGFVAAMRHLKRRSGLTYRQLEERAAERGDVLPRSTLADVLSGRTMPRPDVLTAFVRACGSGQQEAEWLRARERIVEARAGAAEPPRSPAAAHRRARKRVLSASPTASWRRAREATT
ncbi:helix-turn-helix domain-containing protein [Streptomyces triculaminicus]|uniref:Helix-turn-helix domain-containing protein n=3 Tax=Streptomyces TaxID=1883 RepID=A0A939FQT4_9ACTN|nr:helix-turn-helix domain-containing protein [Streptomyces triculaminicus]MBO0654337.1 helix-turn-helix domain-containing protein [Streptomyces triculaminicus]QSY48973.1 helix-turn-helix domain-containing protein [Streptomyces griseocarneus]